MCVIRPSQVGDRHSGGIVPLLVAHSRGTVERAAAPTSPHPWLKPLASTTNTHPPPAAHATTATTGGGRAKTHYKRTIHEKVLLSKNASHLMCFSLMYIVVHCTFCSHTLSLSKGRPQEILFVLPKGTFIERFNVWSGCNQTHQG